MLVSKAPKPELAWCQDEGEGQLDDLEARLIGNYESVDGKLAASGKFKRNSGAGGIEEPRDWGRGRKQKKE